ncbi:MAG: TlyA family RNA methyltransferase [Christensenellales bacterium]
MKARVDSLLATLGLAASREQAQKLIMAGRVYAGEVQILKPSQMVDEGGDLLIRGPLEAWASRGAHKMEKALSFFEVAAEGLVCLDIGAASGGFTDALLRRGAAKVYAVDVGYGQLAWRLRQDPRVVVMERTNARTLTPDQFPDGPRLCVMDVSFISIRLLLPVVAAILGGEGRIVCLIKPQFEAGKGQVGKHGVVREAGTHERVLREICAACPGFGWSLRGLTYSPIKGPKGNIEFLADIRPGEYTPPGEEQIAFLVARAHEALRGADEGL